MQQQKMGNWRGRTAARPGFGAESNSMMMLPSFACWRVRKSYQTGLLASGETPVPGSLTLYRHTMKGQVANSPRAGSSTDFLHITIQWQQNFIRRVCQHLNPLTCSAVEKKCWAYCSTFMSMLPGLAKSAGKTIMNKHQPPMHSAIEGLCTEE